MCGDILIVKFDTLNRVDIPTFTLCNPGSTCKDGVLDKVVGPIVNHEAEELVLNFNSQSELNFRVVRQKFSDSAEDVESNRIYMSIKNRRLIFVDDIGYFMITDISDGFDGTSYFKDVKAESIESEISQKIVPYIADGTYRFSYGDLSEELGIFEKIVAAIPLWSIGHIDDSVSSKYRTFEDVDTSENCLGFLIGNIQDAFECIVLFDCINRVINVYDQSNYVKKTNIHITSGDLIQSIDISENSGDLYTAINVTGNQDVMISAINPTGSNVIYDFSYYFDWMTPSLGRKVIKWQSEIEDTLDEYYSLNLSYYNYLTEANNLSLEIQRLDTQIKMYERCKENIIASDSTDIVGEYNDAITSAGGTEITIHDEISETLSEIASLIRACNDAKETTSSSLDEMNGLIQDVKVEIDAIHSRLSITRYFTSDEYSELGNYIFEGNYSDEYVTFTDIMSYDEKFAQMKILYDRTAYQLSRVSRPTQEFSIDVQSFVFSKEFQDWTYQLETGCLVGVDFGYGDVADLFLSSFTINYDDKSMSMTFGNRYNKFDPKSLFDNMLGDITKSANTISYIKDIIYPVKNGEINSIKEALQTSRDLTMGGALSSQNEEVVIDGSGYTGKKLLENGEYDPRQIKITGRNIVFTDDEWESCKTAVGEITFGDGSTTYGVNAETIVGDIIIGSELRILDSDGKDILSVMDGMVSSAVSETSEFVQQLSDDLSGVQEDIIRHDQENAILNDRITKVEQDANEIAISISNRYTGGVNFVRNSAGLNGISDDWKYSGSVSTQQGTETKNSTVSNSCFVLGRYSTLTQDVTDIVGGQSYRISARIKKTSSMSGYFKVSYNENKTVTLFEGTDSFDWKEFSAVLTDVLSGTISIQIYSREDSLFVSDIMLTEGDSMQSWAPAPNEIYTTEVKIDRRGIEVSNLSSPQRTVINNVEFSGYYNEEKVFTLNKDETKTKKTTVDGELTVGGTKFIPVSSDVSGMNIVILD